MKPTHPIRHIAALLVCLIVTAGCSVDLPGNSPPARLFVLSPKSTFDPDLPRVPWQLTIEVPVAEAGLNTARIALRRSPLSLEYFERANWIDTAPRMIQTLLVESFENSSRIVAVGRQSVSLRADYSLITELREFQAEYGEGPAPAALVRLTAKLVKMPQRNIVATMSAEEKIRADGPSLDEIIPAFDKALGKALKKIVEWTLGTAPPTEK
jgi:cholesterol transport system auxiliary component